MSGFRFQFETLLELRQSQRDVCRQSLVDVRRREAELLVRRGEVETQRNRQLDNLRRLESSGTVDIDASRQSRVYVGRLSSEFSLLDDECTLVAQRVVECQKALQTSEQAVAALEKLKEQRLAVYQVERERCEMRELQDYAVSTGRLP